jgi:hypothetical protein
MKTRILLPLVQVLCRQEELSFFLKSKTKTETKTNCCDAEEKEDEEGSGSCCTVQGAQQKFRSQQSTKNL